MNTDARHSFALYLKMAPTSLFEGMKSPKTKTSKSGSEAHAATGGGGLTSSQTPMDAADCEVRHEQTNTHTTLSPSKNGCPVRTITLVFVTLYPNHGSITLIFCPPCATASLTTPPTCSKRQVDEPVIKTPFKPHRLQSKELAPLIVPPVQLDLTLDNANVSDVNGGHGDSKTKLSTDSATSPTKKVNSGFERVAAVIVLQRHWRKLHNQRRADDERLGAMDDAEADRLDKNLARLHDRGGSKKAVGLGSLLRQRTGNNQDADSGAGRLRGDLNSKRALPPIGSAVSSPALDDTTTDTQDADGGQTTGQRVYATPPTLGDEALSSVLAPSVVYYWLKPKIPTALRPWSVPWAKYTPMSYVVAVFVFN